MSCVKNSLEPGTSSSSKQVFFRYVPLDICKRWLVLHDCITGENKEQQGTLDWKNILLFSQFGLGRACLIAVHVT